MTDLFSETKTVYLWHIVLAYIYLLPNFFNQLRNVTKCTTHFLFLDLHLQISWNPSIYLRWLTLLLMLFCPIFSCCFCLNPLSLICLFHFTNSCASITILFIICCFSLSLSLSLNPLDNRLLVYNIPKLSLSFSLSKSSLQCKSMDVFVLVFMRGREKKIKSCKFSEIWDLFIF